MGVPTGTSIFNTDKVFPDFISWRSTKSAVFVSLHFRQQEVAENGEPSLARGEAAFTAASDMPTGTSIFITDKVFPDFISWRSTKSAVFVSLHFRQQEVAENGEPSLARGEAAFTAASDVPYRHVHFFSTRS
ncbi:MAG TPA: hypothetical protein PKW95_16140 [bacterium]|nr:hypothetical protein [bacterium]